MSKNLNSLNVFNNQPVPSSIQIEKEIKLSYQSVTELKQEFPELADNLDCIFYLAMLRDLNSKINLCEKKLNNTERDLTEKDILSDLTFLVGKLDYENRQVPFIDLISINPDQDQEQGKDNEIEHSVLIPGQGIQSFNLGDASNDNQNEFISFSQYISDKSVPVNVGIEKNKHNQNSKITQYFEDGINSVNVLIRPLQNYQWQSLAKNNNEEMPNLESPITMEVSIPNPKGGICSLIYRELYKNNSIQPWRIALTDGEKDGAEKTLYELNPSTGKYKVIAAWNVGYKIPNETLNNSKRFNIEKTLDEVKASVINNELKDLVQSDHIKNIFELPRKGFPIPTDIIRIVEECNRYIGKQELIDMNNSISKFVNSSQKGIADYVQEVLTSGELATEDTISPTPAIVEAKER